MRTGGERAEVTAEFALDNSPAADWLREHDLDNDGSLLLRRLVDANGRSRAYLNGSPVTVQQLREVAERLVDIHGQHAHQSLLRSDAQRALLDAHGRLDPLLAQVRYRLRKEFGAAREGKTIGVSCVFSRETVMAPDASCAVEGDGSLNCHGFASGKQ